MADQPRHPATGQFVKGHPSSPPNMVGANNQQPIPSAPAPEHPFGRPVFGATFADTLDAGHMVIPRLGSGSPGSK